MAGQQSVQTNRGRRSSVNVQRVNKNPRTSSLLPPRRMSTTHHLPRAPKAPILNPFETFPAKDFDAFVDDITSALRRALGHETDPPPPAPPPVVPAVHLNGMLVDSVTADETDESVSALDEAEFARRRAIAQGKRRDPRERPGESAGEPIEILSGSEANDEEEEESEEEESEEYTEEEEDELDYEEEDPIAGSAPLYESQEPEEEVEEEGNDDGPEHIILSDSENGDTEGQPRVHKTGKNLSKEFASYFKDDAWDDEDDAEEEEEDEEERNDLFSPPGQYTPTPPNPSQHQFPSDSDVDDLGRILGPPPPILAEPLDDENMYTFVPDEEDEIQSGEKEASQEDEEMDMQYSEYLSFDQPGDEVETDMNAIDSTQGYGDDGTWAMSDDSVLSKTKRVGYSPSGPTPPMEYDNGEDMYSPLDEEDVVEEQNVNDEEDGEEEEEEEEHEDTLTSALIGSYTRPLNVPNPESQEDVQDMQDSAYDRSQNTPSQPMRFTLPEEREDEVQVEPMSSPLASQTTGFQEPDVSLYTEEEARDTLTSALLGSEYLHEDFIGARTELSEAGSGKFYTDLELPVDMSMDGTFYDLPMIDQSVPQPVMNLEEDDVQPVLDTDLTTTVDVPQIDVVDVDGDLVPSQPGTVFMADVEQHDVAEATSTLDATRIQDLDATATRDSHGTSDIDIDDEAEPTTIGVSPVTDYQQDQGMDEEHLSETPDVGLTRTLDEPKIEVVDVDGNPKPVEADNASDADVEVDQNMEENKVADQPESHPETLLVPEQAPTFSVESEEEHEDPYLRNPSLEAHSIEAGSDAEPGPLHSYIVEHAASESPIPEEYEGPDANLDESEVPTEPPLQSFTTLFEEPDTSREPLKHSSPKLKQTDLEAIVKSPQHAHFSIEEEEEETEPYARHSSYEAYSVDLGSDAAHESRHSYTVEHARSEGTIPEEYEGPEIEHLDEEYYGDIRIENEDDVESNEMESAEEVPFVIEHEDEDDTAPSPRITIEHEDADGEVDEGAIETPIIVDDEDESTGERITRAIERETENDDVMMDSETAPVVIEHEEFEDDEANLPESQTALSEGYQDPFQLMGNNSTVAPGEAPTADDSNSEETENKESSADGSEKSDTSEGAGAVDSNENGASFTWDDPPAFPGKRADGPGHIIDHEGSSHIPDLHESPEVNVADHPPVAQKAATPPVPITPSSFYFTPVHTWPQPESTDGTDGTYTPLSHDVHLPTEGTGSSGMNDSPAIPSVPLEVTDDMSEAAPASTSYAPSSDHAMLTSSIEDDDMVLRYPSSEQGDNLHGGVAEVVEPKQTSSKKKQKASKPKASKIKSAVSLPHPASGNTPEELTSRSKRKREAETVTALSHHSAPSWSNKSDDVETSSGSSAEAVSRMLVLPLRSPSPSVRPYPSTSGPKQKANHTEPQTRPAPPLLHRHSARHTHAPPKAPAHPTLPNRVAGSESSMPFPGTSINGSVSSEVAHAEATSTHKNGHMVPAATSTHSPITRSQCRFHKISLPREEGGPRINLIVPGCSLNDKELMEEEEIEDHGDATPEDYENRVDHFEDLPYFSSELIGIVRQLVGLDLLRENEVFYLPLPGEVDHEANSQKQRHPVRAPKLSMSNSFGARKHHKSQLSIASKPSSIASTADLQDRDSTTTNDPKHEGSDSHHSHRSKRKRSVSFGGSSVNASSSVGGDDVIMSGVRPAARTRRSTRLSTDGAAYVPTGLESDPDSDSPKSKKKKGKRGIKRSRTSEAVNDHGPNAPKTKKLKETASLL